MSDQTEHRTIPTISDVERISALADPVIRNLQITQCYHELSLEIARRTGACANWCTFATWASKQAGSTIRGEDLRHALERMLGNNPLLIEGVRHLAGVARGLGSGHDVEEIRRVIWDLLDVPGAARRASEAVARGNRKVFAEIALEFTRFIHDCLDGDRYDPARLRSFLSGLRADDPPNGQEYLRRAFTHYYHAFTEGDTKKRAELVLLANIEIGFHEQTRLQPEIAAALDAALSDPGPLADRLIATVFPMTEFLLGGRLLFAPLEAAAGKLLGVARQVMRKALTEHMMTLGLASGRQLRLGDDLHAEFPASLRQVANTELLELLQRVDPTSDTPFRSGATDWADLAERLHFIADMFRCYHETGDLLLAPFTPEQTAALKAGQVPEGAL